MYKNNLVVVVKHNGKVLREIDDYVSIPFMSEYSLLIKNLNSKKASVNVSIDGEDVLSNNSLLISPNSSEELEGFLKGNTAKNKFRFIRKTKQISKHRGDREDDGLIRVEFAFEKENFGIVCNYDYVPYSDLLGPVKYNNCSGNSSSFSKNVKGSRRSFYSDDVSNVKYSCSNLNDNSSICSSEYNNVDTEEGITVKGSEINQWFNYGSIGSLGKNNVMVIRLVGKRNNGTYIKKHVTTKSRLVCSSCGKRSRSDLRFCGRCGTFLR